MALTTITTGMEKGPEAINTNFNTLGQFGTSKCVALPTVSTVLNGLTQSSDGSCSFEVVDPINRVARISFETAIGWPDGYQSSHGNVPGYSNTDVLQFNSSLFKSLVPNTPLIGKYTFNGWGTCDLSTYVNDHTVGFKTNNGDGLNTGGGATMAGSFLAYY